VEIDGEIRGLQQRVTESQLTVQNVRTTREHHLQDLHRIRSEHDEAGGRIDNLIRTLDSLQRSIEQSQGERERQEGLCRDLALSVDRGKADLTEAQERQAEDMAQAQQIDIDLEAVRKAVSSLRESRMTIEVKRAEVRTQLATIESTLSGTYEVEPATLPEQSTTDGLTDSGNTETSADELKQQLQKIRERLDRMGPINIAAINEHQELDERHRFLTTQEQDLTTSITALKEIIQRINHTTKDMFATTFAELQEKFGQVFTNFFPGGRAELQLVEVLLDETAEGKGPQ